MNTTLGPDDWWKGAVVYQIYPRSFADSDGDGVGDLPGITGRLDHLATLGVDVLWLSPVYASPQDDNGYDISDYTDVDPLFGTLDDLRHLIEEVHARGMRLVMDLVVNHTSDEHPWFVESRSSRDNPRRDWYVWRDPRADGVPNNWLASFSGPAWTLDEATGQYYLHLFSPKQPDLNWENPEVRTALWEMMRWWLDQGVDGFRMDVINHISKLPGLPDAPGGAGWLNGPRIHEYLAEMNREVLRDRGLIAVGEMPGCTVADARAYTDPGRHELNMVFTFEHVTLDEGPGGKWDLRPLDLRALKRNLADWQVGLGEVGWNSLYWNNHDQPRVVSRWGNDGQHRVASAKALGTVLHLLRGTPYVYQGEELGMTNAGFTGLAQYRDIESLNWAAEAAGRGVPLDSIMASLAAKGRDNARTPMQWDASPNAGFSTGTPWLDVNPNHTHVNAEAALADSASVFHHYRRLIELRHSLDVVVHGDFTLLAPDDPQLFAYRRTLGGSVLTVVANLSDAAAALPPEVDMAGEVILGERTDVLAPWAAFVTLQEDPAGVTPKE